MLPEEYSVYSIVAMYLYIFIRTLKLPKLLNYEQNWRFICEATTWEKQPQFGPSGDKWAKNAVMKWKFRYSYLHNTYKSTSGFMENNFVLVHCEDV